MALKISDILNNRYRIDKSLGHGGMADVFKVWDNHRAVFLALKLLREDLAQDPIFLRRFTREAHNLEKLQHPNIVRFYGLERDGLNAFILMEYVNGNTLRADLMLRDGKPFMLEETLEIIRPVCSALFYAHRQGLVHCDVKPANIMREKNGRVLLADFGIARLGEGATTTMVGAGTPAYMAPELIRGKDPVPQTDIYALGIVLYEMLTGGERPFTGDYAKITGSTSEKVRWEHLNQNPPPMIPFNKAISPQLDAVVMKCLAKNPEDRYISASELAIALETAISQPVKAIPVIAKTIESSSPPKKESIVSPEPVSTGVQKNKSRLLTAVIGGSTILLILVGVLLYLIMKNAKQFSALPRTSTPIPMPTMPQVVFLELPTLAESTSTSIPTVVLPPTYTPEPTLTPTVAATPTEVGILGKVNAPASWKCRQGPDNLVYGYDGTVDYDKVMIVGTDGKLWFKVVVLQTNKVCWVPRGSLTFNGSPSEISTIPTPALPGGIHYGYQYALCNGSGGWQNLSDQTCLAMPACYYDFPAENYAYANSSEALSACRSKGYSTLCIAGVPFTHEAVNNVASIKYTCPVTRIDHFPNPAFPSQLLALYFLDKVK